MKARRAATRALEAGCQTRGADPDAELRDVLGNDADIEAWWAQVGTISDWDGFGWCLSPISSAAN